MLAAAQRHVRQVAGLPDASAGSWSLSDVSSGRRCSAASVRGARAASCGARAAATPVSPAVDDGLGAVFGGFAPLTRVAPSKPVEHDAVEARQLARPISSSARLSRMRSSRATSSFADGAHLHDEADDQWPRRRSTRDPRPRASRARGSATWLDCASSVAVREHRRLDRVDVGVVGHGEVEDDARPALRHVADAQDLAVAHEPERAVHVAHLGDADADLLDDAGGGAEVDDVADAELVLDDHEQAVEHVLHDVLRAEAEAGADRGGEQRERAEDRRCRSS